MANPSFIGVTGAATGYIEKSNGDPERKPLATTGKPRTGRQDQWQGLQRMMFGGLRGPFQDFNPDNPCGFPDYGPFYAGTFSTYRFMRRHPVISHVRGQVRQAIIANAAKASIETRKGTEEGMKALIADMFTPQVNINDVEAASLALDYGFAAFEQVWETRQGKKWLTSRPLAPDGITFLCQEHGEWAGVKFGPGEDQWLSRYESWFVSNEMEYEGYYGVSRLENIREYAWKLWLDYVTKIHLLGFKLSGKLAVVTTPAGTFTDQNGNPVDWKENAMLAGQAATDPLSNNWIWLPSIAIDDIPSKENVELAKASFVSIDVKDFGDYSPAIAGMLELVKHAEGNMSHGYLRSPRTNQESQHGSRADAEEHTDTDSTDLELTQAKIINARNKAIDDVLEMNYGPKARGSVWFKAAPLKDAERSIYTRLVFDGVLKNPQTSTSFLMQVNWDPVVAKLGIAKKEPNTPLILDPIDDTGTGNNDGEDDEVDDAETDDEGEKDKEKDKDKGQSA